MQLSDFPGCCGANVLHHFPKIAEAKVWDMPTLAKYLFEIDDYDTQYTYDEIMVRPIWSFTHSSAQNDDALSPRAFAAWLREQGEYVRGTSWITHDRHKSKIIAYTWHMSPKFRKSLTAAMKKLEK